MKEGSLSANKLMLKLESIAYVLLIILTCECVVGSSGRWLVIGNISIRMILFTIAFIITLPFVLQRFKLLIKNAVIINLLVFALFIIFSVVYGLMLKNNASYIKADLTSMMFLALVPGYIAVLNTTQRIGTLVKYASIVSIILACIVISLHFLLSVINGKTETLINSMINDMSLGGFFDFGAGITRIYFKSSICFILPFLYNLNLLIKNDLTRGKKILAYICMTLSFTATVITYTRSFWLGFALSVSIYLLLNIKSYRLIVKSVIISVIGFFIFVMLSWASYGFEGVLSNVVDRVLLGHTYTQYYKDDQSGEKEDIDQQTLIEIESENTRDERIKAAIENLRENWLLGNGFGQQLEVKGYLGKIEYTYLDIWGKMGIAGFLVFLSVLLLPVALGIKDHLKKSSLPYVNVLMCTALCIYIASIYNPFITSPIGFSIYAVFVASLYQRPVGRNNPSLMLSAAVDASSNSC